MKEVTSVLEDSNIKMKICCWGGRWKKKSIKISSVEHLRYNRFKQNLKSNNYTHPILYALSDNVAGTLLSNLITLYHYITEYYEEELIPVAGDSGLTFSSPIATTETASMMHNVGVNISQLHILFRILRNKIGVKLFEPEIKMTDLFGEMIVQ